MNDRLQKLRIYFNQMRVRDEVEIENVGERGFFVKYEDITLAWASQSQGEDCVVIYSPDHWDEEDYLNHLAALIELSCRMQRVNYLIRFTY